MLAELENLFALQDKNYREFHARLMPNIEKERIIGIRVPVLRKYAKEAGLYPVVGRRMS